MPNEIYRARFVPLYGMIIRELQRVVYLSYRRAKHISIFHGCMVWIEKSVTRVTDRHHEACRVMPNSDPE